ncbi:MAPEG family protein [Massilia sp. W12]|uniref:MAPEG family protein n=1 Tax=Massilia sp. W12 TaxID=3126507 RepID=UPI0030CB88E1
MQSVFFGPLLGMTVLIMVVWLLGVRERVSEMQQRRISPQSLAHPRDVSRLLERTNAMDNYNNLLQAPLLFYVLCLALAQNGIHSAPLLGAAWLYVLLRCVHSMIQVGANRVVPRFYVWLASSVLLWGMWLGFAWMMWG